MDRSATAYKAARFVQNELVDLKSFLAGTLKPKSYIPDYYKAAEHLQKSIIIIQSHYPEQYSPAYDLRTNAHYTVTVQDMLKIAHRNNLFAEQVYDFLSPESQNDELMIRKAKSNINVTINRSAYRAQLRIDRVYESTRKALGLSV